MSACTDVAAALTSHFAAKLADKWLAGLHASAYAVLQQ